MSPERKQYVDIRALGRFSVRLLYLCAAVTLAGLPARCFGRGEGAAAVCLPAPRPVLLAGVWGSWRYDRKFPAGLKKRLGCCNESSE